MRTAAAGRERAHRLPAGRIARPRTGPSPNTTADLKDALPGRSGGRCCRPALAARPGWGPVFACWAKHEFGQGERALQAGCRTSKTCRSCARQSSLAAPHKHTLWRAHPFRTHRPQTHAPRSTGCRGSAPGPPPWRRPSRCAPGRAPLAVVLARASPAGLLCKKCNSGLWFFSRAQTSGVSMRVVASIALYDRDKWRSIGCGGRFVVVWRVLVTKGRPTKKKTPFLECAETREARGVTEEWQEQRIFIAHDEAWERAALVWPPPPRRRRCRRRR